MAKGKKTGGRKKGTQNRHTIVVKDAVLETLANLGGAEGMTRWARRNRTQFYRIAARLIPQEMRAEITGASGGPIVTEHEHNHSGAVNVSVTGRIDALAAAFESAADRAGAGGVPGDGAGQPMDPGRDQGGEHAPAG
jgi:hypothetical protein